MHGRVVTTRAVTQRIQARPQQALRPVNYGNPGEVLGSSDLSQDEARRQQTLKYREDSKKFVEKEKQKAQKKKEEKWKRYNHVDIGQRLTSDDQEFEDDVESVREQQQLTYDRLATSGLELERQREAVRLKREERRKEEKLKKYSNVAIGHLVGSTEQATDENLNGTARARRQSQSEYKHKAHSTDRLGHEQQRKGTKLEQEHQRRNLKLRRYDHVDMGRRMMSDAVTFSSPGCSRSSSYNPDTDRLERQVDDINLNVNYDRAMEEKTKHYQSQKLKTETLTISPSCIAGPVNSQINNLNRSCESETEFIVSSSQADKDEENRKRMRLARDKLQKKYDEELRKSS